MLSYIIHIPTTKIGLPITVGVSWINARIEDNSNQRTEDRGQGILKIQTSMIFDILTHIVTSVIHSVQQKPVLSFSIKR